jgi:serine/threonine-protein kinase
MSEFAHPSAAEQVRGRFVAAWDEALSHDGPTPDLDALLAPLAEPERAGLRPELEALERSYRGRRTGGTVTGATADTVAAPEPDAGTVDFVPSPPEPACAEEVEDDADPAGTVQHRPGGSTEADGAGRTTTDRVGAGAEAVPETVAGYEILGTLGRGAMGVVYKARQPGLQRVVALKMILAGGHAGAHDRARFRIEAEAIAGVQHANIVQIYEVGEEDGRPFFSLEYVPGGSLKRKVNGEPQPPRQAAELARLLALAVQCAHEHGVIHRDLKPANVLLTRDGVPKITDFGLAKRADEDSGQTHSGAVVGTPSYMAPEQAEGKTREVGPLSDVYALGALLYELLTGRPPFKAASFLDTLEQVRTREPVPPTALQPKVPHDLETVCLKCLEKDPARRYASAADLAEDLRRFLAGEPVRARPTPPWERAWRWCRRNPRVAGLSAGLVLFVAGWAATATVLKLEADASARLAAANAAVAEKNERLAARRQLEAEASAAQARRSEAQALRNAHITFHHLITVGEQLQRELRHRRLKAGEDLAALRAGLLATLQKNMLAAARDIEGTEVTSFSTAAAYQEMGDLLQRLGQGGEALRLFRKSHELLERLAAGPNAGDKARANLGILLRRLGSMSLELNGDVPAARRYFQKGRDLQQDVADHPRGRDYSASDNRRLLSFYELDLGTTELAAGRPAEARAHFEKCRDLRRAWSEAEPKNIPARSYLSEVYLRLGTVRWHLGDARGARADLAQSLKLSRDLAENYPQDSSFRADVADILGAQGDAELRLGRPAEARARYREALPHIRAALDRSPDNPERQALMALTHERLAAVALHFGERPQAEEHYRASLKLRQELARIEPGNRTWRAAYLLALAHGGKQAEAEAGADALCKAAPGSAPLLLQAARCYAVRAAADPAHKEACAARALRALGGAAAAEYRDAVALETDPDLAALRQEPAFRDLLAKMRQR